MSLTKSEAIEKNRYELQITIDKATFDAAVSAVYRKQVKSITVPGFRKGIAPRSIIEKMYGKGVFYEDAINDLIPEAYTEAIKEAALDVVGQPEFDVVSIDDNGLVLSAKVYVKPEVEIKDYLGIEVEKEVLPVTDEEVDKEIETVRERNSREIEITDRAAAMGDTTVIDFEGFCDGVAFEGGKGTDYALKLGSGSFIPGFEEQIVGKNIDEEFDVNVTFPAEYHAADLAGKAATFKVKIHAITSVELPALDDDFAKDISEFDTFDEYKADLKAKIQTRHDKAADSAVEEKLVEALIEKLEADIPEPIFVAETENFVRDYDSRLRSQGLDLNTYFKYTGMTLDSLREQVRPQAERQVKARLALEKIAALENVEVTDEDINGEYETIANAYGVELDQVKASIDSAAIAEDMKVKKAMDLVKEKAVVNAKKAPAKKSTTKKAPAKKVAEGETAEAPAEEKPAAKKAPAKKTTAAKKPAEAKEVAAETESKE
ncbi:MAG: trigger factor [Clostridia bacterium]|nr:trigger factor [Clostridia bacterium]